MTAAATAAGAGAASAPSRASPLSSCGTSSPSSARTRCPRATTTGPRRAACCGGASTAGAEGSPESQRSKSRLQVRRPLQLPLLPPLLQGGQLVLLLLLLRLQQLHHPRMRLPRLLTLLMLLLLLWGWAVPKSRCLLSLLGLLSSLRRCRRGGQAMLLGRAGACTAGVRPPCRTSPGAPPRPSLRPAQTCVRAQGRAEGDASAWGALPCGERRRPPATSDIPSSCRCHCCCCCRVPRLRTPEPCEPLRAVVTSSIAPPPPLLLRCWPLTATQVCMRPGWGRDWGVCVYLRGRESCA